MSGSGIVFPLFTCKKMKFYTLAQIGWLTLNVKLTLLRRRTYKTNTCGLGLGNGFSDYSKSTNHKSI